MIFFLVLIFATTSEASIRDVFSEMYFRDYRSSHCHDNSVNFVSAVSERDKGETELVLVKVQNKGAGTFGLVNAEKARSFVQGKLIAEEKNWYEHWFVMDASGTVYDFDFSFTPTPMRLSDYIEEMFLKEDECITPSWTELCGGRDDKLNEYWVTIFEAKDLVEHGKKEVWSGSLSQFTQRPTQRTELLP